MSSEFGKHYDARGKVGGKKRSRAKDTIGKVKMSVLKRNAGRWSRVGLGLGLVGGTGRISGGVY